MSVELNEVKFAHRRTYFYYNGWNCFLQVYPSINAFISLGIFPSISTILFVLGWLNFK